MANFFTPARPAWRRSLLGSLVLLAFLVLLFAAVGITQHKYVRHKLVENTDGELAKWAKQLSTEIAYNGRWELNGFRHANTECDTCYVIANDGLLIEVEEPIPRLLGPVKPVEGFVFGQPVTIQTETGESWRLLGTRYDAGIVIVGIAFNESLNPMGLDSKLRDNLAHFGSTFESATKTTARNTDYEVNYIVVDRQGDIINAFGGVPMRVDLASLPIAFGEIAARNVKSGDRTVRIYSEPIGTGREKPAAMLIVGKDITQGLAGVADQDRFNILVVAVVIALSVASAGLFLALQARRRRKVITLEEALRVGESKTVEFKSTFHWDPDKGKLNDDRRLAVLRAIDGFLNADGGTLFIGVAQDQGGQANVCGVEADLDVTGKNQDDLRLRLTNLIAERIGSPLSRFISDRIEEVDGKHVWIVEVEPGNEPTWVRWDNRKRFFVREGPRTSELDSESTYRYIRSKWGR